MVSFLIKDVLERCGFSQRDLADLTGMSLQRIKDLSSGRVMDFKTQEIEAMVSKLHLNPGWITSNGTGDMFQPGYWNESKEMRVYKIMRRMTKLLNPDTFFISDAEVLGVDQSSIEKWRKKGMVSIPLLLKVAKEKDVSIEHLLFGDEIERDRPNRLEEIFDNGERRAPNQIASDLVLIPCLNVRASAGYGNHVHEELTVGHFQVSRAWVRNVLNCEPGKVEIIFIDGPSMEPTLEDGELVLVDRRCDGFDNDAVYAIQYDGHLRIKRVQLRWDGTVVIKSDNPAFDPEVLTKEQATQLHVIGKVLPWKFGKFKL